MMRKGSKMVGNKREAAGQVKNGNKKQRCIIAKAPVDQVRPLQKLYQTCKEVFKGVGTVPTAQDVEKLCHMLDDMKPEDVGLNSEMHFFKSGNVTKATPTVKYATIYQCNNFSLCMFFLPPKAVIPLHNHPGMTVFSKLLLGSMHIKSYDWAYPEIADDLALSIPLRFAKRKANDVFTAPCNTSVLYPTSGGNIHAFTAVTPCAVLDVLGPPYSLGRDCTYYREVRCSSCSDAATKAKEEDQCSYGWLEEIEMPKDLKMEGIKYMGPSIIFEKTP